MFTADKLLSSYKLQKKAGVLLFLLGVFTGLCACISGKKAAMPLFDADQQEQYAGYYYSIDRQVLAKGQQLFDSNCSACHNFRQKGIGPNLAEVTSQASPAWLTRFIGNAPEMIKSGDSRATGLFEVYNQYMPPFPTLSEADIQALLAYIHASRNLSSSTAKSENLGIALQDPIPAKIVKSGLRLNLEEITTAPASADKVPLARINKMLVLAGKKTGYLLRICVVYYMNWWTKICMSLWIWVKSAQALSTHQV